MYSGLFTDEFKFGATPPEYKQSDVRAAPESNTILWGGYRAAQLLRGQADRAADALKKVSASDKRIGEVLAIGALMHVILAEQFCSGIPLGDIGVNADPQTTTQVLQAAVAKADAAIAGANGDATVRNFASVIKGRALLDLKQYDQAAAAVAAVPTDFVYKTSHSTATVYEQNNFADYMNNFDGVLVSDKEGINGLNFATAGDPRVPITGTGGPSRFDGSTPRYYYAKFSTNSSPNTVASGVEARLIEAEAKLNANDVAGFLQKLTDARTFYGMAAPADPGSATGRVDLLFRERAFSMFATGHRLGDLRRLVRQYGRAANTVYPTGSYHKDGLTYGTDLQFVVPSPEKNNPKFTGCLDRNA
jgi:hypothetical protein